jgi:hypothetical protein
MSKEITKLKKKADGSFSRYIRYRDGKKINGEYLSECITCGVWKPVKLMQAGHFVSRSCNLLRYDELNVHAQCVGCNMFKSGEQYQHGLKIDLMHGEGTAEALHSKRHITHKLTKDELESVIRESESYLKELGI